MERIIDSHTHLWPESMSNEEGHAWMTPGMPLAKEHVLQDYYTASDSTVECVVYVETDVRYEAPSADLASWAKGPLEEIRFLRAIVEGKYGERDSQTLKAIVAWAPIDQKTAVLEEWLRLAEETAGEETWRRVKGFRFLLQAIYDEEAFRRLVLSKDFINNLQLLGRRGFSFDVGVDQHSGGTWQLRAIVEAMRFAHKDVPDKEKVVFILNHLCKPDFSTYSDHFDQWKKAIASMSKLSMTYMKLSGAFSELPGGFETTSSIAQHIRPWVGVIFNSFGAKRTMFGSDWPVCNLRGPKSEQSWNAWKDVVTEVLEDLKLSEEHKSRVWRGTAIEAYGIIT